MQKALKSKTRLSCGPLPLKIPRCGGSGKVAEEGQVPVEGRGKEGRKGRRKY